MYHPKYRLKLDSIGIICTKNNSTKDLNGTTENSKKGLLHRFKCTTDNSKKGILHGLEMFYKYPLNTIMYHSKYR